jgi:hypothetical protein
MAGRHVGVLAGSSSRHLHKKQTPVVGATSIFYNPFWSNKMSQHKDTTIAASAQARPVFLRPRVKQTIAQLQTELATLERTARELQFAIDYWTERDGDEHEAAVWHLYRVYQRHAYVAAQLEQATIH